MFRVQKAHGQQHQFGLYLELAAGDFGHHWAGAVFRAAPLDADGVQLFQLAVSAGERFGEDAVIANPALFVGGGGAEDQRPFGPGVAGGALRGRLGQQFVLLHDFGALAVGRAEAVGAGVAAAQNHHPLALGADAFRFGNGLAGVEAVLLRQIVHSKVDAVQLPARRRQVAGLRGAAGQADGVEFGQQPFRRKIVAHIDAGLEDDALFLHQGQAAAQHLFVQLEIGDAQGQQPAGGFGALIHRYQMAGAVELLGGGQPRRAGTDHGDFLAGALRRRFGLDPAFLIAPVGDFLFDVFDGDRVGVDAEDATGFAGGRADAAGEFGEVVGGQQGAEGVFPAAQIDLVVEFGDDIAQGTTRVAERHGAVHAAAALRFGAGFGPAEVDFLIVADALGGGAAFRRLASGLQKPGRLTHGALLPAPALRRR